MWTYDQATGNLTNPSGEFIGTGYSGDVDHWNQSQYENLEGQGPIPRGLYTIGRFFDDVGGKGPLVAHLAPSPDNEMFGRSGFMIHGDNAALNHTASEGCIVLPRVVREAIVSQSDRTLQVV